MAETRQINVRLKKDLHKRICKEAIDLDVTYQELFERIVQYWIDSKKRKEG